jgi:caffeoyl-CoA O-methyltransferase
MVGSPPEKGFGQGSAELAKWAESVYRPEDDVLREIRERSVREGLPPIQVGRFDGLHLEVLARIAGVRSAVEIGTLGGYSGVCLLRGMHPEGRLHTLELSEHHARVAAESFRRAGFGGRAIIHVGPALENLARIENEGPFDLAFLDADKLGYPAYLAWAEEHLRIGGIVLADNTFGWGRIAARELAADEAASVRALREFSERLARGGRMRATMIPTEEGLSLGIKIR